MLWSLLTHFEEQRCGTVVLKSAVPRLAALATPGNYLEMPIIESRSTSAELVSLGVGPSSRCFNKLCR